MPFLSIRSPISTIGSGRRFFSGPLFLYFGWISPPFYKIFRLLVFSRILYPGSKKKAYDRRNIFFEGFNGFCLDDVYYGIIFL